MNYFMKRTQDKHIQNNLPRIFYKGSAFLLMGLLVFSLSACKKSNQDTTNAVSTESIDTLESSDTADTNEASETKESTASTSDHTKESSDTDTSQSSNEIEPQKFTFIDLNHNIYIGTIGNENVIVDLCPNAEIGAMNISFIDNAHLEDKIYICEYSDEYKLTYEDDDLTIILQEIGDGVLTGSFTEGNNPSKEISLQLSHINMTNNCDTRYSVGTNEEVEAYAVEIMKVIKEDDIESLYKMIQYPVSIHLEEGATADNPEDLIAMSAPAVITKELKAAMANTFPRFMFSKDEGIMLGSGEYNIWFNKYEDGFKITGINN